MNVPESPDMAMSEHSDRIDAFPRSGNLLDATNCRVLIVDMQEKLLPVIDGASHVASGCRVIAEAATIFNVPIRITEQYPQGLGSTVSHLATFDTEPTEKLLFSAAEASAVGLCRTDEQRNRIVVCGIETHICVLQTAFDLHCRGWRVCVVADAVGARKTVDHSVGLQRMRDGGIDVITTEMVLFEWAAQAGTPEFKKISRLVRARDE